MQVAYCANTRSGSRVPADSLAGLPRGRYCVQESRHQLDGGPQSRTRQNAVLVDGSIRDDCKMREWLYGIRLAGIVIFSRKVTNERHQ